LRVENHYVDWGWDEKVEKVKCQSEKRVAFTLVAGGEGRVSKSEARNRNKLEARNPKSKQILGIPGFEISDL
jgi:hypothetical protein